MQIFLGGALVHTTTDLIIGGTRKLPCCTPRKSAPVLHFAHSPMYIKACKNFKPNALVPKIFGTINWIKHTLQLRRDSIILTTYTGRPKKNGVQLQIAIIQRWLDRLKLLIFYFETCSFLFRTIFLLPIFKKKLNDNKSFSASGHFKMHEKRYWFLLDIWKP